MTLKNKENMTFIKNNVSQRSLYCQLAEEASELAQACLKYCRAVYDKDDNPTPVSPDEAMQNIVEELGDVLLVCDVLEILSNKEKISELYNQQTQKLQRWCERIKN